MIRDGKRVVNAWSAACSTGEEPYTLAIVLQEFAHSNPTINYAIFASDISTQALNKALLAVYTYQQISTVDKVLQKKYFLKCKKPSSPTVRIVPELRQKVTIQRMNLMDASLAVSRSFDLIFCRNVLIYFDRKTQEAVIEKLLEKLLPGGYLFIGHSESLFPLNLPVIQIKPTIYKKI